MMSCEINFRQIAFFGKEFIVKRRLQQFQTRLCAQVRTAHTNHHKRSALFLNFPSGGHNLPDQIALYLCRILYPSSITVLTMMQLLVNGINFFLILLHRKLGNGIRNINFNFRHKNLSFILYFSFSNYRD